MKQTEIIDVIESFAPLCLAASWDRSGMQVASAREDVRHLAVCLDPLPESVEAALQSGAEMVLSHHPLALNGLLLDSLSPVHRVVRQIMLADVPLYAAHTSLDANPGGPVSWLARELRLAELEVLEPSGCFRFGEEERVCGFGVAGDLAESLSLRALVAGLAPWASPASIRVAGAVPDRIRRVGICPGSGSSLAESARALRCDVLITGDVKYHTALETPLCLMDVGHFSLEEEMMRRFAGLLAEALPAVRVTFIPAADPLRLLDGYQHRH